MKVSIIIPAYNCEEFLPETLRSAQHQNYDNYEIIVVDDGSTDGTARIAQAAGGRVRYFHQTASGGCSRPRNNGMNLAAGEYIALLDGDDIMDPDQLALLSGVLDSDPDIHFAFTDYRNFTGTELLRPHSTDCIAFAALAKQPMGKHAWRVDADDFREVLYVENPVTPSAVMFRKNLLDKIGGFREELTSCEDIDFTFRATAAGAIGYIDKPCLLRRLHASNMSKNLIRMNTNLLNVYPRYIDRMRNGTARRTARRQIARVHQSLGFEYRKAGRPGLALRQFLLSILKCPVPNRSYLNVAKTLATAVLPRPQF